MAWFALSSPRVAAVATLVGVDRLVLAIGVHAGKAPLFSVEERLAMLGESCGPVAKAAGCEWLHVDFEPDLAPFYFDACGFRPTPAGLIHLASLDGHGVTRRTR